MSYDMVVWVGERPADGDAADEEVSAYAAGLAVKHGLVCYDPQEGGLRP